MNQPLALPKQPDAAAPDPSISRPSFLIYFLIFLTCIALIGTSRYISGKFDWSSVCLNISSSLISALVVLIVVERRIRKIELGYIVTSPIRLGSSIYDYLTPTSSGARSYADNLRKVLDSLTKNLIDFTFHARLKETMREKNALLIGQAGSGKTVLIQEVALEIARAFLSGTSPGFAIVIPLRDYGTSGSLRDMVCQSIMRFSPCGARKARLILERHVSHILFDGLDEVSPGLTSKCLWDIGDLRKDLRKSMFVVSSRPHLGIEEIGWEVLQIPALNEVDMQRVRKNFMERLR